MTAPAGSLSVPFDLEALSLTHSLPTLLALTGTMRTRKGNTPMVCEAR